VNFVQEVTEVAKTPEKPAEDAQVEETAPSTEQIVVATPEKPIDEKSPEQSPEVVASTPAKPEVEEVVEVAKAQSPVAVSPAKPEPVEVSIPFWFHLDVSCILNSFSIPGKSRVSSCCSRCRSR
jgi:hypothetical protein